MMVLQAAARCAKSGAHPSRVLRAESRVHQTCAGVTTDSMPSLRSTSQPDRVVWANQLKSLAEVVRRQLHGRRRCIARANISKAVRDRERRRSEGQVKRYIDKVLARSVGREGSLALIVKGRHTGDPEREALISDPADIKRTLVAHFREWMGFGRKRWYLQWADRAAVGQGERERAQDSEHALWSDSEEGRRLRRRCMSSRRSLPRSCVW